MYQSSFEIEKFLFQERLTAGHGSLSLSSGSQVYGNHVSSRSSHSSNTSAIHSTSMQHQLSQSDFQPPYFPPPFNHAAATSPQQSQQSHVHSSLEYLTTDPYSSLSSLHHYNQLGLRARESESTHHHHHHNHVSIVRDGQ